ncbi:SDR family NAD(P)-dependent oxidoreductase [Orrella sp. 11846]|uniref:SDR family NAD(P)-dependent oxidoreductase n=1 Tax=Orrella sp. 11846 TaxID=3409913 RepID=UPI003B5B01F9
MLISLENKVAVITGASQGLGLAMAKRFCESGADVVLLARRQTVLDEACEEIAALRPGAKVKGYACDVRDLAQLESVYETIERDFGKVDIVVNNAGSSSRSPIEALNMDTLQADYDLKVKPAMRLVQLAVPGMKERRWGRIINVVNIGAKAPDAGTAPTSMSRAAGIAMTKVMSKEFAPHNVLVNALCVGQIMSEQWVGYHKRDHPEMTFEDFIAMRGKPMPLGRIGQAEEFANVACFLASDQASFVSGVAINVDGGQSPVL